MDYEKYWAKEYIQSIIDAGIMIGDGNGNFRPDVNLTRAEAPVIVSNTIEKLK